MTGFDPGCVKTLEAFVGAQQKNMQKAVRYAIYTEVNARLQTIAIGIGGPINYISAEEGAAMDNTEHSVAQTRCAFDDRIEHRLRIGRRPADDVQYLAGRTLMLECF